MPSDTSIIAPPYHVQSTAAELRSGFPYFAHHDSISALWSQKWRLPCVQGIYPFTDGGIQDFEPIFAGFLFCLTAYGNFWQFYPPPVRKLCAETRNLTPVRR